MKNLQKGTFKIVIVFFIFFLIIGAVFFSVYQNKKDFGELQRYKNTKFGYEITLPHGWQLPKLANAYIDLTKKHISDSVNEEIFDYGETGGGVTVKDQDRLIEIENKITNDAKTWDPFNANYVIFTDVAEEDQIDFYNRVGKKEELILEFFPNRTIRIQPSEHIPELTALSTTTPRRVDKTITLSSGVKAEYKKLINPTIGVTFVYVPMTSDEITYSGEKINSLQFVYLGDEISEDDFMSIVNSVSFDNQGL